MENRNKTIGIIVEVDIPQPIFEYDDDFMNLVNIIRKAVAKYPNVSRIEFKPLIPSGGATVGNISTTEDRYISKG